MSQLTAYIAIGAVIVGLGIGSRAERCGRLDNRYSAVDLAATALIWPGILAAAVVYDIDTTPSPCTPSDPAAREQDT